VGDVDGSVWAIFGELTRNEIVGIGLTLLIAITIMIWARWLRKPR